MIDGLMYFLRTDANLIGEAGVQGTEEPGEAAGTGSWSLCEEAGTDSTTVYARARAVAGDGPG